MASKLNVYFPINNINPQGWISEFITPVLTKTGINRDMLSSLFYNSTFEETDQIQEELIKLLKSQLGDDYQHFLSSRKIAEKNEEKMLFLNGNFLDLFEVDETIKNSSITDKDMEEYIRFMTTAKPFELSFLQPYLRLYYGYRENKKSEFTWVDMPFTQKFDLDYILSEKAHGRAEGSGITNVKVDNKFNLATQINSEISISYTFGSMKILTGELSRSGNRIKIGEKSDLPYGFNFMKLIANLDFTKEAIRLEYGRKVADGFEQVVKDGSKLKSIIESKEKKEYLLSKYSHTFSFDEKGVISLTVNYYNFHDAAIYSPNNISIPAPTTENIYKLNIAKNAKEMLENYRTVKYESETLERQLREVKSISQAKEVNKIESTQKSEKIKDITKKLAKTNKTLNLIKRSFKQDLTTVFLDGIKSQGQLFSVNFNTLKQDKKFLINTTINLVHPKTGDFLPVIKVPEEVYDSESYKKNPVIKQWVEKSGGDKDKLLEKIFSRIFNSPYDETKKTSSYGNLMFFPLKALLSVAYSFLEDYKIDGEESEREKIPYMMFGNVLMKVGGSVCSINIGDLLVESGVFQRWYYEKFYKKDRLEYSFGAFIQDIITDLIPEVLYRNRIGFDDKAPTTAIKQTQFYLKRSIPPGIKKDIYLTDNEDSLRELSRFLSRNPTSEPKPLIYYGQLTNKTTQISSPLFSKYGNTKFKFSEIDDIKLGIPHIKIGSDGGCILNVDFQAQDFSKIRTALAMESLADKSSRYFFFYYQLGITMLGNNLTSYDSIVCVPSNPLGIDSEINDPGIAGYYKVKETSDSFDSNNKYETKILADWVFNKRDESMETSKIESRPTELVVIRDTIPLEVNDPLNYIVELIENDPLSVINSQIKNGAKLDSTKKKNKAVKNKPKLDKKYTNLDNDETLSQNTPKA